MDLRSIARALGGEVVPGGQVNFPPPGHSRSDRSGSLRLDPRAPDGFLINTRSPADDPLHVKDWVRDQLGWARETPRRPTTEHTPAAPSRVPDPSEQDRAARALDIYREAGPLWGSPAEAYLTKERRLCLFDGLARALRYHPACPFAGTHRTPAMIALVRDVRTDEPRAIHRTALTLDGRKAEVGGHSRLTLGPIAGGAIKLTPDEEVTLALGIGEGIESALSLRHLPEFGTTAVWSLIAANGVERLPMLPGVESLWIAVDHDEAGIRASRACADRWRAAGAEAFLVRPHQERTDLNDVFRERLHG